MKTRGTLCKQLDLLLPSNGCQESVATIMLFISTVACKILLNYDMIGYLVDSGKFLLDYMCSQTVCIFGGG